MLWLKSVLAGLVSGLAFVVFWLVLKFTAVSAVLRARGVPSSSGQVYMSLDVGMLIGAAALFIAGFAWEYRKASK